MNLGGTDKWQQYAKEVEDKVEFKSVSSQKYKISKMAQGLFEYVPLIFDEQHFCVSQCCVHSVLLGNLNIKMLDYRFRFRPFKKISEVFGIDQNDQTEGKGTKKAKPAPTVNDINWKAANAAEFLFCDENGKIAY